MAKAFVVLKYARNGRIVRHGSFADIYAAAAELDRIEEKEGVLAWATPERCVERSIAHERADRRRVAWRRGSRGGASC